MNLIDYEDVLSFRRSEISQFTWSSKKIDAVVAYKQSISPTPNSHKKAVLNDPKIKELIRKLSVEKGISEEFLEGRTRLILDEIGYNKNVKVIRWLGLILIKICSKLCQGIYVNSDSILHRKSMGECPVIFVPSHRSYADFILMSFLCFNYDVAIPAIAAGMDFHGMLGMGSMLRDTGAFFMRRSYNSDVLYWTTFKQYIYQLVTKGELPIEFFIEGTRSRSNKSLMPKYGLLNMILKPLFLCQVPDIIFVPINISYQRILEEKLFAFELLGVPKPKESTSGFFKSLSVLKENFGSIYVTFGDAISSKSIFGDHLEKNRRFGPIHSQELDENDKKLIPNLAFEIVTCQQRMTVLNSFNLFSMVLNEKLIECHGNDTSLSLEQLKTEIESLKLVLKQFGAKISNDKLEDLLEVHRNIVELKNDRYADVVKTRINLENLGVNKKLKAYNLSGDIMTSCIPFILLYIYINPVMSFIIDVALILKILTDSEKNEDNLLREFEFLRKLFINDFVTVPWKISEGGSEALSRCLSLNLIRRNENSRYELGNEVKIRNLFISTVHPFFILYHNLMGVLECFNSVDEKVILSESQKRIVDKMERNEFVHPYCLNLDSMVHCLKGLESFGVLNRKNQSTITIVDGKKLEMIKKKLESYIKFDKNGGKLKNKL